jgi:hypothetical protein
VLTSVPSVFAIINEKKKKVFIAASSNPHQSLGTIVHSLKNKTHANKELRADLKNLSFSLLESTENAKFLQALKFKWRLHFESLGYTLYNVDNVGSYSLKMRVLDIAKVQVGLLSKGKRFLPVQLFDNVWDAKSFIESTSITDALILTFREKL